MIAVFMWLGEDEPYGKGCGSENIHSHMPGTYHVAQSLSGQKPAKQTTFH